MHTVTSQLLKLPTLSLSALAVPGARPSAAARFLAELSPGQLLEATVLEVMPRGAAIRVGERRLLAGTRLDLIPGERLTLRVEQVERQPMLSVLARAAPVGPSADAYAVASRALRASLPVQQPLDRVLRALLDLSSEPPGARSGERTNAVGGPGQDRPAPERPALVLDAWRALLADRDGLAEATRLRARIVDAGLHLEAKLAREALPAAPARAPVSDRQTFAPAGAAAGTTAPQSLTVTSDRAAVHPAAPAGAAVATGSDTKAVLNRLRERAAQAVSLASSAQDRRALELIDNALARIRVLQLASVAAQEESGAVRWHVEIPVAGPAGQIERLEIEVYEQPDDEPNHSQSRRRDPAWQVVLHLEPPELGRLEARIVWRAGAVSARLVAARASTAQALQHDLARLEAGLREAGLTVEALRCEHGEPAGPAGPTGTQPLVHVVV